MSYEYEIRWRGNEDKIIRTNYKRFSDRELQKKFLSHRSQNAIRSRRHVLGCLKRMQKHPKWTPEEIKLLKDNYLNYDQRQLQAKFFPDKTVEQVRSAKMSRGLKKPPVWTNKERELLLTHGAKYDYRDLQKKFFPNKSLSQICGMRKHLGVYRTKRANKLNEYKF